MEEQTEQKLLGRLMTPKEVAAYLCVSESVLYEYRAMGTGQHYLRIGGGRLVRYYQSDVEAWLAKQKIEMAETGEK
jgi:excisionase family DNA binding protein